MSETNTYLYDLFISYARADLAWVDGYLLQNLGLPAERIITAQGFARGASLVAEFEQAIQSSRLTLLIYSPAFPANEWTDFSEQLASHLSVETQRERVGLLLLQPCAIPLRLAPRLTFDCTNTANWDSEMERLRTFLRLPEPNPEEIPCPYPGMAPFRQEDATRFFGREDEIQELRQRLDEQSLILVTGPSGSGKSSLLSAGLIPTLPTDWTCLTMRPGSRPLDTLRSTLAGIAGTDEYLTGGIKPPDLAGKRLLLIVDQLEELFVQTARSDQAAFIEAISKLHRCPGWRVILALRADFYSDLLNSPLWPRKPEQRLEVIPLRGESLRPVIQRPANDLKVHLEAGLVETLIADAADEPGILPLLQQTMVSLWEKRRRRLLPLHAYRAMGDGQRSGLATAVAAKADEALAQLTSEDRLVAQRIFLRLVAFGEGRLDTRRQQSLATLADVDRDRNRVMRVIQHLAQYRLLTLGDKDGEQQTVDIAHDVLITGWPALGDWLKQWRAAELTRRRMQAKAEEWERWAAKGQSNSGLLDAAGLTEAEQWLAGEEASQLGDNPKLQALVDKSRAALRRSRRIRNGVIGALITLVVAVLAAITIGQSQLATQRGQAAATAESLAQAESYARGTAESEVVVRTTAEANAVSEAQARATAQAVAEERRQEAETKSQIALARQLAAQAELMINEDPHSLSQAVLLAVESAKRAHTFEGDQALRRGLALQPRLVFKTTVMPASLAGFDTDISALAFSSDGRWLAIGTLGEIISVRDTSTWEEVMRVQAATPGGYVPVVRTLAFCPDSRRLITGADGHFAQVWDVTTGQELARMEHEYQIWSVACAPDSKTVASGSSGEITVWEPETGQRIYTVKAPTTMIRFGQDGKLAASAGAYRVVVWDAGTGITLTQMTPIVGQEPGDLESLRALALSPDGRLIAAGEGGSLSAWAEPRQPVGGRIWVWETTTGREVAHMAHADEVHSLEYSPDGKWLASGGYDGATRVWNAQTGQMIKEYDLGAPVETVAFMRQGAWIAATGLDSMTRIWDVQSGQEISRMAPETDAQVLTMAVQANSRLVALGDDEGSVYVWEIEGQEETVLSHGQTLSISWLEYSNDGKRLVTGAYDKTARVWDSTTGEEISRITHDAWVLVARFSPDARYVASGSKDGELKVWDAATGVEKFEIPKVKSISSIAFSPDGRLVAFGEGTIPRDGWMLYPYGPSASGPGSVYIWDLDTGQEVMRLEHEGLVNSIAFSPDGRSLVSGSDDKSARVWDVATGREIARHLYAHRVNLVAFSPDSKLIASAEACFKGRSGNGGTDVWEPVLGVWEAASGREIWQEKEQGPWIRQLAFSPDGSTIATASNHEARVRDAATGLIVSEMDHEDDLVIGLAFSRDGRLIASGGGPNLGQGTVRVWDPVMGTELARMPYEQAWMMDFSPNGSHLAVGGYEAGETAVRIYPLSSEASIAAACSRLNRNLTAKEWQQYLNGQTYRETCPEIPKQALQPDGESRSPSFLADPRYVVFNSSATNLVCGDSDPAGGVFLYDQQTRDLARVAASDSGYASISADGRYVLLVSKAPGLIDGYTSSFNDVFLYDRTTAETFLISRGIDDSPSNGDSSALSISDDGGRILFKSDASNLIPNDLNKGQDIFLYRRDTAEMSTMSTYTDTKSIRNAVLSADGRVIAFDASVSLNDAKTEEREVFVFEPETGQLVPISDAGLEREHDPTQFPSDTYVSSISGDGRYLTGMKVLMGNGALGEFELAEIYVLDRMTGQSAYISVAPDGTLGNRDSDSSRITPDGRYVVFASESTNLVSNDTNVAWDVFVYDRQNGSISRVSVASDGAQADGHSTSPAISRDGRYIAFKSSATNLVPDDTNGYDDVFIHDRLLGTTTRIKPQQKECP